MSDPNKPDYIINPSLMQAGIASALRLLTVVITGFVAMLGIIQRRDLAELYAWIQSSDGLAFLTACISIGTFAYSVYSKVSDRKAQKAMEPYAPSSVAQLKETK